jgi:hypothetical protein
MVMTKRFLLAMLAIIDRLSPVLEPEGTPWAQYVAGVVLR